MAIRKSKRSQKRVTPAAESADESLNNLAPPAKVTSTGRIIKKTLKAREEDEHTDSDAPTTEPTITKEKRPKTLDKIRSEFSSKDDEYNRMKDCLQALSPAVGIYISKSFVKHLTIDRHRKKFLYS